MKAKLFQGKSTPHGKLAHAAEWIELSVGIIILLTCIVAGLGMVLSTNLDLLLLAVARQSIVEHMIPVENLLTVLAVGVLFVIRKYLYISKVDSSRAAKGKSEG